MKHTPPISDARALVIKYALSAAFICSVGAGVYASQIQDSKRQEAAALNASLASLDMDTKTPDIIELHPMP